MGKQKSYASKLERGNTSIYCSCVALFPNVRRLHFYHANALLAFHYINLVAHHRGVHCLLAMT